MRPAVATSLHANGSPPVAANSLLQEVIRLLAASLEPPGLASLGEIEATKSVLAALLDAANNLEGQQAQQASHAQQPQPQPQLQLAWHALQDQQPQQAQQAQQALSTLQVQHPRQEQQLLQAYTHVQQATQAPLAQRLWRASAFRPLAAPQLLLQPALVAAAPGVAASPALAAVSAAAEMQHHS